MVSHPDVGSDPPFGSGRESGVTRIVSTIIPVDKAELTRVKYFIQKFKLQNIISPHFLS